MGSFGVLGCFMGFICVVLGLTGFKGFEVLGSGFRGGVRVFAFWGCGV